VFLIIGCFLFALYPSYHLQKWVRYRLSLEYKSHCLELEMFKNIMADYDEWQPHSPYSFVTRKDHMMHKDGLITIQKYPSMVQIEMIEGGQKIYYHRWSRNYRFVRSFYKGFMKEQARKEAEASQLAKLSALTTVHNKVLVKEIALLEHAG
jgi:hypothetical protein